MNLFHKQTSPYYILSPSYTNNSSGVRALHLLCHILNEKGQKAYLVPDNAEGYATNPYLDTPIVVQKPEYQNFYINNGIEPIVVYPDIVKGNPLNAKKVVRYLLAPAGAYGGDKEFAETDQIWCYTTPIARSQGTDRVLLIPTFDPTVYYPSDEPRSGMCFYSHKYDKIHGNKLELLTYGMKRLEGAPETLADILRTSEACYVYEMSEVIVNAGLCGCPVILIRTPYFNKIEEDLDFDFSHVKWSDEEKDVVVSSGISGLHDQFSFQLEDQLERFIEETQG